MNIQTTDAWAAGIFDGEGSITRYKVKGRPNSHTTQLCITQTHMEMLERFQRHFGVGNIGGPYVRPAPNKSPYVFSIRNIPQITVVACRMWPWLGTVKRDQFLAAGIDPRNSL